MRSEEHNQDFNICLVDVKNEKISGVVAGVSDPPSLRAPRASLAPKSPFPSLSNACHAGLDKGKTKIN